jgi:hypothetical protein
MPGHCARCPRRSRNWTPLPVFTSADASAAVDGGDPDLPRWLRDGPGRPLASAFPGSSYAPIVIGGQSYRFIRRGATADDSSDTQAATPSHRYDG